MGMWRKPETSGVGDDVTRRDKVWVLQVFSYNLFEAIFFFKPCKVHFAWLREIFLKIALDSNNEKGFLKSLWKSESLDDGLTFPIVWLAGMCIVQFAPGPCIYVCYPSSTASRF